MKYNFLLHSDTFSWTQSFVLLKAKLNQEWKDFLFVDFIPFKARYARVKDFHRWFLIWTIVMEIAIVTTGNIKKPRQQYFIFNMICSLSMTHSHTSKIPKWPHILVIPLVGSPKPRTTSKNPPSHPGPEKREAKLVILGDFRGRFRVLIRRFQNWACGYEEI